MNPEVLKTHRKEANAPNAAYNDHTGTTWSTCGQVDVSICICYIADHYISNDHNEYIMRCRTEEGGVVDLHETILQRYCPSLLFTYWSGPGELWERPLSQASGVRDRYERILHHRSREDEMEFHVQWLGYPAFKPYATWVPAKDVARDWMDGYQAYG